MRHGNSRPPTSRSKGREHALRTRLDRLEATNHELRQALAAVVTWYDTFDQPGGAEVELTEADFDRFRHLAKALPSRRSG